MSQSEATLVLQRHAAGDRDAMAHLLPLVYGELQALAHGYFRRERASQTLQPTAPVHEAYLKLIDQTRIDWQGRAHFLALAAETMRRILVDHARARRAEKRGGASERITLDDDLAIAPEQPVLDLLELDRVLIRLKELHERQAKVVELRFFGGLSLEEIAALMQVTIRTITNDWKTARVWLYRELQRSA